MDNSTPAADRSPRRLRLATGLIAAALAFTLLATGPASAAPLRPQSINGDGHSPEVATRASKALASFDAFTRAGSTTQLIRFIGDRNAAADAVAREFGLDAGRVRQAWSRAGRAHQVAVLAALSQLGVEYHSNSSEPGVSFDCSGLTAYAWGRAGVALYRQSGAQIDSAAPRDSSTALAGDLVQYPGHVMMYLGVGDTIVHAANPESDVELSTLRDRTYSWGDPSA